MCVAVRTVLASRSAVNRKKTGCDNGSCGSHNGGCELLFGDGAVEHTLDGLPGVPDGKWQVIGISHEVANVFPGVWARPACCLEDERNEVDVWISVTFVLLRSFGHKSWFCVGCWEKGATMQTSKYVTQRQTQRHRQRLEAKHPSVNATWPKCNVRVVKFVAPV